MNSLNKNYHLVVSMKPKVFERLEVQRVKMGEKKKDYYGQLLSWHLDYKQNKESTYKRKVKNA